MQITMQDNQLFVTGSSRFSARQTFTCGQCFRWTEQPDGSYLGIVRGLPARVSDQDGALVLSSDEQQFAQLWRGYFDCDTDYAAICDSFAVDAFTAAAADFGRGIRILRQEPWEALCTFILSQCNNIPRITGIVDRLCTLLGEPISFEQQTLYAFPSPEQLACCTPEDLASLRAGYRTPYLIAAAQAVCSGTVDFSVLSRMDTDARPPRNHAAARRGKKSRGLLFAVRSAQAGRLPRRYMDEKSRRILQRRHETIHQQPLCGRVSAVFLFLYAGEFFVIILPHSGFRTDTLPPNPTNVPLRRADTVHTHARWQTSPPLPYRQSRPCASEWQPPRHFSGA